VFRIWVGSASEPEIWDKGHRVGALLPRNGLWNKVAPGASMDHGKSRRAHCACKHKRGGWWRTKLQQERSKKTATDEGASCLGMLLISIFLFTHRPNLVSYPFQSSPLSSVQMDNCKSCNFSSSLRSSTYGEIIADAIKAVECAWLGTALNAGLASIG
jgi:hypothetical protein